MRTCLDCECLMPGPGGPAVSFCNKLSGNEPGSAYIITPPFKEAENCSMFKQLEDVITDTREFVWDPRQRCYGGHQGKKADTGVDGEKLKDEKYWG